MKIPTRAGLLFASVVMLAACNQGGTAATPQGEQGVFGVRSASAAPGGEARVALQTMPAANGVVTVVGEFNYDSARLQWKSCAINDAAAAGKTLSTAEPRPGVVRTVVVGNLESIAPSSDLITCTFGVAADAPPGATALRVHGDVSDAEFQERPFATEGTVMIGN